MLNKDISRLGFAVQFDWWPSRLHMSCRGKELDSDGWITVYFHLPVSMGRAPSGYALLRRQPCFSGHHTQQRFGETSAGTSPDGEAIPLRYNEPALEINLPSPVQAISSIWSWLCISGPKHTSEWMALHLLAIPLCHPDEDSWWIV